MAERRQVYYSSGGVTRTAITDTEKPFQLKVFTEQQMDAVLESVKLEREARVINPRSPNKLVARVPMTVMETSIHEQWDDADWKKWLNDPANDAFRIWRGRV